MVERLYQYTGDYERKKSHRILNKYDTIFENKNNIILMLMIIKTDDILRLSVKLFIKYMYKTNMSTNYLYPQEIR